MILRPARGETLHDFYFYEKRARKQGFEHIIGIDEVGRGPLAGPVTAAAVAMPVDTEIEFLDDSKKVTPKRRISIFESIKLNPDILFATAEVSVSRIDRINILRASHLAMKQAATKLKLSNAFILIDGLPVPDLPYPSLNIIKGDAKCATIAAASIVAKVYRDERMAEFDTNYPEYGFKTHKGYATKKHLEALERYGPCPIHRRSFAPVANLLKTYPELGLSGF